MDESFKVLDEYGIEMERNQNSLGITLEYFNKLHTYFQNVQNIGQLKDQLTRFIRDYQVPQEIIDLFTNVCQDLKPEDDIYFSCISVLELLHQMAIEYERKYLNSKDNIADIQQNVVNYFEGQLRDVGVDIYGDFDDLEKWIQSEEDVVHLKDNVDRVVSYLGSREKLVGKNETEVILSTDQVIDAASTSGNQNLLDTVLEEETSIEELENIENVEIDSEGSLVVSASLDRQESIDFAKMMTIGLMTLNTNTALANSILGMSILKNEEEENDFVIKFERFSHVGKENFASDLKVTHMVLDLANSFQTNTDYTTLLSSSSPELSLMFQLLENNILGKRGMAQIVIRNNLGSLHFSFGLGEQYEELADSLRTNGATVNQTPIGSYVCNVGETSKGNVISIFSLTNETMQSWNQDLSQGKPYVKNLQSDFNQGGNVGFYILVGISLLEIAVVTFIYLLS